IRGRGWKLDVELRVDAELMQAREYSLGLVLLEDREQLFSHARPRQLRHSRRGQHRERLRLRIHPEVEPRLVPRGAEDPRRILDERRLVEHADEPVAEMRDAVEAIDQA